VAVHGANWGSDKNRVQVNTVLGFNAQAEFSNVGGRTPQSAVGPATGGVNHYYDNGYNLVDSSGNANGLTWNWGYQTPDQIVENTVAMSSSSSSAGGSVGLNEQEPSWGAEITYTRELGWNGTYWWGLKVGVCWSQLSFDQSAITTQDVLQTTDRYALNGVQPPPAPYSGTFNDTGGPSIGDVPTRSVMTLPGAAVTSGDYSLDSTLYLVKIGLLYETLLSDRFSLQFGGGGLVGMASTDVSYSELTRVGGLPLAQSSSVSDSAFLGGGYAEAGFAYYITERVSVFLGAQYMYLSTTTYDVGHKQAELSFKNALAILAGVGVTF
jgi:hypothetical protein